MLQKQNRSIQFEDTHHKLYAVQGHKYKKKTDLYMKQFKKTNCHDFSELKSKLEAFENLEKIEEKVVRYHENMKQMAKVGHFEVTDIPNYDQRQTNFKKLNGDFKLVLNHELPMAKKIEQFAIDPVSFHLHKQRNFVHKLELEKKRHQELQQE